MADGIVLPRAGINRRIRAGSAFDRVVARAAGDDVIAVKTVDTVVTAQAIDDVSVVGTIESQIACRSSRKDLSCAVDGNRQRLRDRATVAIADRDNVGEGQCF